MHRFLQILLAVAALAWQVSALVINCNTQPGKCPPNGPKGSISFPGGTNAIQSTDGGDGSIEVLLTPHFIPNDPATDSFTTMNFKLYLESLSGGQTWGLAQLSTSADYPPIRAHLTIPSPQICGTYHLVVEESQSWYRKDSSKPNGYSVRQIRFRNAAPQVTVECIPPPIA